LITPLSFIAQGLQRAYLEIVQPTVSDPLIPLKFNPTDYQLHKQNTFADVPIPGLESPPIQFVRGECEKLTVELLADTSDTLEDVRLRYTNKLRGLMNIQSDLHAPPIVRFIWDAQIFLGVVESLNITFQLFTPEGVPIRAKIATTLKEYRPAEKQTRERPTLSPDFDKAFVARAGDTLSNVAAVTYKDPGAWRAIARANGIEDPRALEPGRTLNIPRLR